MSVISDNIYDYCIIGAGASGLSCAVAAASQGKKTVVLEKNRKAGRKLYATGNGRCNLTNRYADTACYRSKAGGYMELLFNLCHGVDISEQVCDFMEALGVMTSETDGYVYPASMQASSVVWAMLDEIKSLGAEIKCGCEVTGIKQYGDIYTVQSTEGEYRAENVVLAAGSCAYPSLGGSMSGYSLAEGLGLNVINPEPVLTALKIKKPEHYELLKGVRARGRVDACDKNGKLKASEYGEVQFTEDTLSGIVCFNMASLKPEMIRICFFDKVPDREAFIRHADRTLTGVLNGFVNDKLAEYMVLSFGLERNTCCSDISIKEIDAFVGHISELFFTVTGTEGFEKAQAATGGICLDQIDAASFAVKGRKGLYACGELLDIDGKCGGYNLTFAILSGLKAGGGYHASNK